LRGREFGAGGADCGARTFVVFNTPFIIFQKYKQPHP
jgi:hypothetical protein